MIFKWKFWEYAKLNKLPIDFLQYITDCSDCKNKDIIIEEYIINNSLSEVKKDLELYEFYYKFNDLSDAYFKRLVDNLNLKGNTKHNQIICLLENCSDVELERYYDDISKEIEADISKKNFLSQKGYDLDFLLDLNNIKSTNNEEQDLLFYIMNTSLNKIKNDLELYDLFSKFLEIPDKYLSDFFETFEGNKSDKDKQISFLINNYSQNELHDILKLIKMKIREDNSKKLFFKNFKLLNSFSEDKLIGILIECGLQYTDNKQENIENILKHLDISTIKKIEKQYEEKIDLTNKLLNKDLKIILKENYLPISNKKQENIDTLLKNLDLENMIQNKERVMSIKKQLNGLDDFILKDILLINNIECPGNEHNLDYVIMENMPLDSIENNINDLKQMLTFIDKLEDIELQIVLKEYKLPISNIRQENVNLILKNLYYDELIEKIDLIRKTKMRLNKFNETLLNKILSMNNLKYNDCNVDLDDYILKNLCILRIDECINEINSMLKLINGLYDNQIKIILKKRKLPISKSKQDNINSIIENFGINDLEKSINELPGKRKSPPTKFMKEYVNKLTGSELEQFIIAHDFPNGGSKEENRRIILEYSSEKEFFDHVKIIHPEFRGKTF